MKHASFSHGHVRFTVFKACLRKTVFLAINLHGRNIHVERQKSSQDDVNKRRQNSAEKSSDASPSERLQKSRSSHLIGSGINPRDGLGQQVDTDEAAPSRVDKQNTTHHDTQNSLEHDADRDPSQDEKKLAERDNREKQAITTPSDGASDLSSTQDRNEKHQLSALEEEQQRKWSKSISLDEYGYRVPKTIELADVATRDKPILLGGMDQLRKKVFEKGGPSHIHPENRLPQDTSEPTDADKKKVPDEAKEMIGKRLGTYKLVKYLGEGGFAYVYRGKHIRTKEIVAVKVLHKKETAKNKQLLKEAETLKMQAEQFLKKAETLKMKRMAPEAEQSLKEAETFKVQAEQSLKKAEALKKKAEQFLKEAETLKKVKHPHIVQGLESGTKKGVDYLVMEYAPKGTLRDVYPRPDQQDSRWSPEKVVAMVNDLADALRYLHDNEDRVHLDLKPENVLRGADGQLLLSDFGLVKEIGSQSTERGFTPGYTAPERLYGRYCPDSDQYSLAVMAYEAFTGRRPWDETSPSDPLPLVEKIQGVSEKTQKNIQDVIFKALVYNPDDRHENVKIFAEKLEKACFGRIREKQPLLPHLEILDQKIKEYQKAIDLNPHNADAHLNMGLAHCRREHYEDAVASFNKAIEHNLRDAFVYYYKGDALKNLNRRKDALEAYEAALSKNPKLASVYINKGNVLRDLGQHDEATIAYEDAIHLYKEFIEEHKDRGRQLSEQGEENEEAQKAFKEADDLKPEACPCLSQ